jgi:hypothetical protein
MFFAVSFYNITAELRIHTSPCGIRRCPSAAAIGNMLFSPFRRMVPRWFVMLEAAQYEKFTLLFPVATGSSRVGAI